ncbi:MAG: hypothetical protein KF738_16815 [Burkholderiales bacterium]|nr:hypothetical protein [Burkholderiales bacterium]
MNADPLVQARWMGCWNRYSYVMNNPLATPTPGYSWWTKWREPILAIAAAWALGPGGFFGEGGIFGSGGLGWASGTTAGYTSAAASGFAAGGIQGGNLESAIQGAFSASLFFGVGELTQGVAMAGKVAAHAAAGCASGAAAGGSCRSGALSAGFAELAGPLAQEVAGQNVPANIASRAVVGGAASRLGGGNFENGAVTAAFGYLFNHCAHGACTSDFEQVLYDWWPGYKAGTLLYNQTMGDGSWTGWEVLDAGSLGVGVTGRGLAAIQGVRAGSGVGVEIGANANQVAHAFRHVDALGLPRDAVTAAIQADMSTFKSSMQVGQTAIRTVTVVGVDVTYHAHRVTQSLVNIGRITAPRP